MQKLLFAILILIVSSCAKDSVDYSYPDDPENKRKARPGKFFEGDVVLYGEKKIDKITIETQNKLFLSAKRVVNEVSDIDIADDELGLISSKWRVSEDSSKKTKITILIKGEEVIGDNLNISIFKEYIDEDGKWQKKKSENEELLIKLLKEKIITGVR